LTKGKFFAKILSKSVSREPTFASRRSFTRATKIFLKIPHRLESSSFFAYFFSPKEKK